MIPLLIAAAWVAQLALACALWWSVPTAFLYTYDRTCRFRARRQGMWLVRGMSDEQQAALFRTALGLR